jgi:hypothetical protein
VLYHLHALRGPTFVFNGTADGVVTSEPEGPEAFFADLQKRTIEIHGGQSNVFEYGFAQGVGHRPYFVTRPVVLWLERQLDFPNWTAESIARQPETHIGDWARRERVFIEPAYNTEAREAGVRALGSGIPGIPRERLNGHAGRRMGKGNGSLHIRDLDRTGSRPDRQLTFLWPSNATTFAAGRLG